MSEHAKDETIEAKETQVLTSGSESGATNASDEEVKNDKSDKVDVVANKEPKRGLKKLKLASALLKISNPFLFFLMVMTAVNMGTSATRSTNAMPEWYHILIGATVIYGVFKFGEYYIEEPFELPGVNTSVTATLAFIGTSFAILASGSVDAANRIYAVSSLLVLISTIISVITLLVGMALAKDADEEADKYNSVLGDD